MKRMGKIETLVPIAIVVLLGTFSVMMLTGKEYSMADENTPATDYSGVREYVGARYVPVFAEPAEWDSTKTYDPLTIVLYQGNSYTSTQYVPAGVGINDTNAAGSNYWLQTGNYNAQVEAYRKEVQSYDKRISDNTTAIGTFQSALTDETTARTNADTTETDARKAADNELADRITSATGDLQGQINALNSLVAGLDPSKGVVIVIGDSIAEGWSSETPSATGWPILLRDTLGFPSSRWIVQATGGAGFSSSPTTSNQIGSAASAVTSAGYSLDDVRMVIIGEGVNDARNNVSTANITSGVNAAMTACKQFPNATVNVVIGIMGNVGMGDKTERVYRDIENALMQSAQGLKINAWQAWTWNYDFDMTKTNDYVSSDHIHLKAPGLRRVANLILGCLNGNRYEFDGWYQSTTVSGSNGPLIYRHGRTVNFTIADNYTSGGSDNLLFTCPKSYLMAQGCIGYVSKADQSTGTILFPKPSLNAITTYQPASNTQMYGTCTWTLNSSF